MGCDIHIYAEVKNSEGKWEKIGKIFDNLDYDQKDNPKTDEPYIGRNYELFALLANVRNSFGIEPIAKPRDLPEDVSVEIQEKESMRIDYHSHSYYLLKELLDHEELIEASQRWRITMDALKKLGDPENVRIVFWFDN